MLNNIRKFQHILRQFININIKYYNKHIFLYLNHIYYIKKSNLYILQYTKYIFIPLISTDTQYNLQNICDIIHYIINILFHTLYNFKVHNSHKTKSMVYIKNFQNNNLNLNYLYTWSACNKN